jgi:hypothetical protein
MNTGSGTVIKRRVRGKTTIENLLVEQTWNLANRLQSLSHLPGEEIVDVYYQLPAGRRNSFARCMYCCTFLLMPTLSHHLNLKCWLRLHRPINLENLSDSSPVPGESK